MNILMLTYEVTQRGGSFIRAHSLARELVILGHRVTLLSGSRSPNIFLQKKTIDGVKVVEVGDIFPYRFRHDGMSPMQIINRIIHISGKHYDVVHGFGHRPSSSVPALYYRKLNRVSYIADWSDLWGEGGIASLRNGKRIMGIVEKFTDTAMEKTIFQKADAVSVVCTDLYDRMIRIGKNPDRLILLPPGANSFKTILSESKAREILDLPLNIPIVVYVGNAPYDQAFLGETVVELFRINQSVILLFAGANMPEFNRIIRENGYSSRVIHRGFVQNDKLAEIIISGDVMLLPYLNTEINRGRYPNKIGDYIGFGKPTVTNPTGEVAGLFRKYKIGLLANYDPVDFAKKTDNLLNNPKLRKLYGNNALKLARSEFSWKTRAKSLVSFYERVVPFHKSK
jgi:glycosyltransferase involved in cell wall biosynthesis